MSNERQETIADIVADIRAQNLGLPEDSYALSPLVGDLLSLARRIEVANARERGVAYNYAQICGEIGEMIGKEATREKSSQVGNAAKMREALEKSDAALSLIAKLAWFMDANFRETREVMEAIKAALSAPPRNCDIGTVEEQAKRFHSFCKSNKQPGDVYSCERCQLNSIEDCELAWAQMPYEEGDEK